MKQNPSHLETQIQRHDNPHYWLQQVIFQIKNFQYRFVYNIILNDDTIPQVKILSQFLLKFLRFNHQLLWEQQDQNAYINFPQVPTETELLPYIISNEYRRLHYRDPTSFNVNYFEQINLDNNFITERSETSYNRPYTTSNISPEITQEEHNLNTLPHYTPQNTVELEQDDFVILFQTQESQQLNPIYPQQQNTQSLIITKDSNLIQFPTHNITPDPTNNQNQENNILNTTQDNTSILSTSNTNIFQPFHTQRSPRQNFDPPPIPPQFSTQINTHNSPQQGSSNTQPTHTVHFQTTTPSTQPVVQTSTYAPAQTHNIQTGLNINTLHSNPPSIYTTSRNLSRPPLQPILTNPLSYNLTSTNSSHTQHSSTNNNQLNSLNTSPPSQTSNTMKITLQNTQFHIPKPPLILTLITHLTTLLQILQISLRTIQYHHLQYLKLHSLNRLT